MGNEHIVARSVMRLEDTAMYDRKAIRELASDFKEWGRPAVRRIQKLTKRHGVICNDWTWSSGKKG